MSESGTEIVLCIQEWSYKEGSGRLPDRSCAFTRMAVVEGRIRKITNNQVLR